MRLVSAAGLQRQTRIAEAERGVVSRLSFLAQRLDPRSRLRLGGRSLTYRELTGGGGSPDSEPEAPA